MKSLTDYDEQENTNFFPKYIGCYEEGNNKDYIIYFFMEFLTNTFDK